MRGRYSLGSEKDSWVRDPYILWGLKPGEEMRAFRNRKKRGGPGRVLQGVSRGW